MDGILIFDQPRNGAENMAIDDAMLQWCDTHQKVALRIYRWAKPTLSLGYFQPWEEWLAYRDQVILPELHVQQVPQLQPSSDLFDSKFAVVRRRTGGGAIVHHHDWTYSLVVPWDQVRLGPTRNLYQWIHDGLAEWLTSCGFSAHLQSTSEPASKSAAFLCFQRRTEGDILVGTDKIIGSAQRRGKRSLLQHGSVLLARSRFAAGLPGLAEITQALGNMSGPLPNSQTLDEPSPFGRVISECTSGRFDVNWENSDNVNTFGLDLVNENLALHRSAAWLERV
jgi:lipoate-protein ligase A